MGRYRSGHEAKPMEAPILLQGIGRPKYGRFTLSSNELESDLSCKPKIIEAPFPSVLIDVQKSSICGAKNRAGTPCKNTTIYYNGRCKFHGGLSTGPTSAEGKARSSQNGLRPKKQANPMEP